MAGPYLFLDSKPLGLACDNPNEDEAYAIGQRMETWSMLGARIVVPEVVDYEVRRELIRTDSTESIRRLDKLGTDHIHHPITRAIMRRAARLWAEIRRVGTATSDDLALDGDVILAAQALEYAGPGDDLVIITDNVKHLGRFATTSPWQTYLPPLDGL